MQSATSKNRDPRPRPEGQVTVGIVFRATLWQLVPLLCSELSLLIAVRATRHLLGRNEERETGGGVAGRGWAGRGAGSGVCVCVRVYWCWGYKKSLEGMGGD